MDSWPCIDPSEAMIPQSPYECFRKGEQARIPLMVGSNSDEGSLIAPLMDSKPIWRSTTHPDPATGNANANAQPNRPLKFRPLEMFLTEQYPIAWYGYRTTTAGGPLSLLRFTQAWE